MFAPFGRAFPRAPVIFTLSVMKLRVWPAKSCPNCGGHVVRERLNSDASVEGDWVGGVGELPGWAGLAVGALVARIAGNAVGVYAGIVVAVVSIGILLAYARRGEKRSYSYSCERCGKHLRWGNWRQRASEP